MSKPGDEAKPKTKIDALEETVLKLIDMMEDVTKRMDKLEKTAVKKSTGLFGGKRERTAIKDTKTGVIYPSKAAVGKALADEFGLDALDHFAWYKIQSAAPDRFVEASDEEAKEAWKKVEDELAKKVAADNARIQAEQAGKK